MSKGKKIALIVAAICIVSGLVITIFAMSLGAFDEKKFDTYDYVENVYEVKGDFTNISIKDIENDVILLPSSDDKCTVAVSETANVKNSVSVEDNTLVIKKIDTRKWYDFIGIWSNEISMDMIVYLPESQYEDLYIKTVSGNIKVSEEFIFDSADISSTSGDIDFSADVETKLVIESTSGDIELAGIKVFDLNVHTSSGEIEADSVISDNRIRIDTTSGDIDMSRSDAKDVVLDSISGEIDCEFLSPKIFDLESTSGDIKAPQDDASGGNCTVKTTSGDIHIRVY